MLFDMNLTVESAKTMYNWFHYAFPDYKNNEYCKEDDIQLRDTLEAWLIEQGE